MVENLQEELSTIENNFKSAMSEFIRQSGYVEGTLDALISTTMDTSPEISIVSDRLIKTFHAIEGICKQGLASEFDTLLQICKNLYKEKHSSKIAPLQACVELMEDNLKEYNSKGKKNGK